MDYFDILLAKKLSGGGGGDITVEGLNVEENGTYTAPSGKAYSPVVVQLPLGEKAITANGEYNASADDLKGYSKVTVNVAGFKVKDMPTGAISSFADGTENPLKELKVSIVPVQSGSGDPSPSNPRPISGWTGTNINVFGNKLIPDFQDGETLGDVILTVNADKSVTLNGTATATVVFRGVLSEKYKWDGKQAAWISGCPTGGSSANTYSLRIDGYTTGWNQWSEPDTGNGRILENATGRDLTNIPIAFGIVIRSGYVCDNLTFKPMLNLGTEAKPFEPYNPLSTTTPISLGQEVYGGELDVTSGILKARPYYASYNGETLVGPWISSLDEYEEGATPTTGAQVVDLGGTETTYQLTPTQITTLLGTNNIWADCGDVISGKYFASL